MSTKYSKDKTSQQSFDTIERRILKLPDIELTLEDLKPLFDELYQQALDSGDQLALSEMISKIVAKGKQINKINEALFISQHSLIYKIKPDLEVLIRPVIPSDQARLVSALSLISPNSLFLRFMHPIKALSQEQLDYLSRLDYVDHFAFCVLLTSPDPHSTDNGIAVGRYIREYDDSELAEWTVTVLDTYQGCGLGSALLYALSLMAMQNGIKRFGAVVHPTNERILNGLKKLNPQRTIKHGSEYYIFDLPVPDSFVANEVLREQIKEAALGNRGDVIMDYILKELDNDKRYT